VLQSRKACILRSNHDRSTASTFRTSSPARQWATQEFSKRSLEARTATHTVRPTNNLFSRLFISNHFLHLITKRILLCLPRYIQVHQCSSARIQVAAIKRPFNILKGRPIRQSLSPITATSMGSPQAPRHYHNNRCTISRIRPVVNKNPKALTEAIRASRHEAIITPNIPNHDQDYNDITAILKCLCTHQKPCQRAATKLDTITIPRKFLMLTSATQVILQFKYPYMI
jgi:hypothetical protein